MATRKRKTVTRSTVVKRRKPARKRAAKKVAVGAAAARYVIPTILSVFLLIGIGYLGVMGYQSATRSDFFRLENVYVSGNDRTGFDDIRRVIFAEAESTGVWNADYAAMKQKIEKFPFVKTASVSASLPSGIKVVIEERVPVALVRTGSGDFLVDIDAQFLAKAAAGENAFPFYMKGWDETKTEKAHTENLARLKMFKKVFDELKQFGIENSVSAADLSNPRVPVVSVKDGDRPINVTLARDNIGKGLRTALDAISGKENRVRSVDAAGVSPVIQFLEF
jgi:cell division septal protein FtsQ